MSGASGSPIKENESGDESVIPLTVSLPALVEDGTDTGFRTTIFRMVTALGILQNCREAFARSMDLTSNQFAVLVGVRYSQGDEGVSIRALADYIQIASTHVTTEVGRLLDKGLLVKRPNPNDGRSVLVSLSETGEEAVSSVAPYMREVNNALFEGFTRKEFQTMDRLMRRLHTNGIRTADVIRDKARDQKS